MRKSDIASGLVLTVFGLVSLWLIIPVQISGHSDYGLAPDFFPRLLMWFFVLLAAALAGSRLLEVRRGAAASGAQETSPMEPADWLFIGAAAAVLAIAYLLMEYAGFIWAGVFTVFCGGLAMGNLRKHPVRLALMCLAAPVLVYMVFRHLFLVFLPT
ncbi:tripartite tricarboxylate transporter TctB family protein [Roseibium marinum]|uniref:Tripartite tricarboxylate transporter TctB family protein n=1 Tax=Roseibium marinum TaxID=281252 RepID=A0A2S3UKQ1_9HYPH|nr:tripartite tricarboxylate transporter TctB family protein [Roseibium marinum]POF28308.1 tripartite tricarboxylate transporter TctB family protein [Roseibium marinum]